MNRHENSADLTVSAVRQVLDEILLLRSLAIVSGSETITESRAWPTETGFSQTLPTLRGWNRRRTITCGYLGHAQGKKYRRATMPRVEVSGIAKFVQNSNQTSTKGLANHAAVP